MKIIVTGYNGKVGKIIANSVIKDKECELIAGVSKSLNQNNDNSIPVFKSIETIQEKADAVIDFSHSNNLKSILNYCLKNKSILIIGTTGFNKLEEEEIKKASKHIPILLSHNTSIGVNILIELVKQAACLLNNFDIEIIEKHHNRKEDAPSGTAKMLVNAIENSIDNTNPVYARFGNDCKRKKGDIGICSIRGGSIVSDHDVIFAGNDEVITISHQAQSNVIFANGAILAAKKLKNIKNGLYCMKDIL